MMKGQVVESEPAHSQLGRRPEEKECGDDPILVEAESSSIGSDQYRVDQIDWFPQPC